RRRTAHRPEPVARAGQARSRAPHIPERGWRGSGAAAPRASHGAGRRPLVPIVLEDRPRTRPLPARPAYPRLFPVRHLLMDSLTHLLRQDLPAQRLADVTATLPHAHLDARR